MLVWLDPPAKRKNSSHTSSCRGSASTHVRLHCPGIQVVSGGRAWRAALAGWLTAPAIDQGQRMNTRRACCRLCPLHPRPSPNFELSSSLHRISPPIHAKAGLKLHLFGDHSSTLCFFCMLCLCLAPGRPCPHLNVLEVLESGRFC